MDVLVLTVVHDPEDTRIRHKQIAALRDAGHAVTYAAPFSAYGRALPDDLEAVDLPRARGRRRLKAFRASRQLMRQRAQEFDIILMHDPELVLAAKKVRHPGLVWDVHEDTAAAVRIKPWLPRVARTLAVRLIRRIERLAERRMTLLLAEDGYTVRFQGSHPVIRNGAVEPTEIDAETDNRVVYLGRITNARGAAEMIELGKRLTPEIEIHLIGHADPDCDDDVMAAHRAGHIHWHGYVPNDQALTHLSGALAGLSLLHNQPNYAYSRPTKVLEYMAYGLPVVTTPNPASVELVDGHGCGIVVPFGDVDAAEAALRGINDDRTRRDQMADAGRKAVNEYYSWNADADLFLRTLQGVAEHNLHTRFPGP
ncbi:glycosyltransferase [Actinobacteria bacterium YIM 96077]|uniref:Glycosyl transferase n=1 Tax=Phytoactinopolyspora halophila TaxID=1981511 RepID=A0A329R4A8_9ACTN|nr:glycosyltransferase [Phytoactinopolyspora halophila]AYY11917.1 glycosyltransferase [Actinobacteria bacterium YIM 96077]RAW18849.1 glycosyl transferase [Phytoactinopolyspora halophila]